MDDRRFFDFVYDQYKAELALADTIPQRVASTLQMVVLLMGATIAVADLARFKAPFRDAGTLFYVAGTVATILLLLASLRCLTKAALAVEYPRLDSMRKWLDWRRNYAASRVPSNDTDAETKAIDSATGGSIADRLADAHDVAASLNAARFRALHQATRCAIFALVPLTLQASFYFWHRVQS
jgi:hypothetical protein